jgi:hypothetical protein
MDDGHGAGVGLGKAVRTFGKGPSVAKIVLEFPLQLLNGGELNDYWVAHLEIILPISRQRNSRTELAATTE